MMSSDATRRPVKRSVALAIHDAEGRVLLVQRPADDDDLPLAWGLPAASLAEGEEWEVAAKRAGRDKLGVDVAVEAVMAEGSLERTRYRLDMRVYAARIVRGEPMVPQAVDGVTQYVAWRWGQREDVRPAADRGSLCSRLYLEATAQDV